MIKKSLHDAYGIGSDIPEATIAIEFDKALDQQSTLAAQQQQQQQMGQGNHLPQERVVTAANYQEIAQAQGFTPSYIDSRVEEECTKGRHSPQIG